MLAGQDPAQQGVAVLVANARAAAGQVETPRHAAGHHGPQRPGSPGHVEHIQRRLVARVHGDDEGALGSGAFGPPRRKLFVGICLDKLYVAERRPTLCLGDAGTALAGQPAVDDGGKGAPPLPVDAENLLVGEAVCQESAHQAVSTGEVVDVRDRPRPLGRAQLSGGDPRRLAGLEEFLHADQRPVSLGEKLRHARPRLVPKRPVGPHHSAEVTPDPQAQRTAHLVQRPGRVKANAVPAPPLWPRRRLQLRHVPAGPNDGLIVTVGARDHVYPGPIHAGERPDVIVGTSQVEGSGTRRAVVPCGPAASSRAERHGGPVRLGQRLPMVLAAKVLHARLPP
mmetsp:Transcript_99117/g.309154  ORF Transcript_99117/g.309154 Transcript_99117/m.309154 type:complete len:339 (+) Transcript_99117:240-1256(+)